MGSIKDRNGMDLTEAENIKKRWQQYTEALYKKSLNDPDSHDSVITHLEPDILECEVKWTLESIAKNKASGGDGVPVELFQILKDDAVKVLHSNPSKFGKLSSGHRTGKGQFSFKSQRKAMPKNVQTTAQLHSSPTLAKLHSKILQVRLQLYMNRELPDVPAGFRKGKTNQRSNCNIRQIIEKAREFQKNIYFWFINYAKIFECVYHNKL